VYVPPSSPFTRVLTTGRSHLQPVLDPSRDAWLQDDEARARVVRATGMHTLMVLPVRENDDILGVAVFVRTENPRPFDEDDLRLIEPADDATLLLARVGVRADSGRVSVAP
jgi:hypothetical protein